MPSFEQTKTGLFVPETTKTVQIFFAHGGRVTMQCGSKFRVDKDERGNLTGLELDSKSEFAFIRLDDILAIEVVK